MAVFSPSRLNPARGGLGLVCLFFQGSTRKGNRRKAGSPPPLACSSRKIIGHLSFPQAPPIFLHDTIGLLDPKTSLSRDGGQLTFSPSGLELSGRRPQHPHPKNAPHQASLMTAVC